LAQTFFVAATKSAQIPVRSAFFFFDDFCGLGFRDILYSQIMLSFECSYYKQKNFIIFNFMPFYEELTKKSSMVLTC